MEPVIVVVVVGVVVVDCTVVVPVVVVVRTVVGGKLGSGLGLQTFQLRLETGKLTNPAVATVKLPRSVYVVPVTVKTLITSPTALPGTGIVIVMAGLNVAEAAPVSCTSTAPDVEAKVEKPAGTGTPFVPEKVAVESAGAVKVNESGEVSAVGAVIVVPGDSVAETPARYPGVPGGVAAVVAVAPVVALPFVMVAVKVFVVAEGFVTTGASPPPPPPHPPAIIKAPDRATTPAIFHNLYMFHSSLLYKILAP